MAVIVSGAGRVRRGDFDLSIDGLDLQPAVTAVVGPNGSGKTTLLRLLAGLDALDDGTLRIDGELVDDPRVGVHVSADRRPVVLVFQDHRLFDHLRAVDNVAFPLRRRGVGRRVARLRALDLLEELGLARQSARRPDELSGGQRQRVALARALAADPAVLLLDEPLASIDDASRRELQPVITGTGARATLLVSHDPVEVRTAADRVIVLDEGRISRSGSLDRVTADPGSRWAATFMGANVVAGRAHAGVVATGTGFPLTVVDRSSGPVHVTFPAHAVTLHATRPEGSARNTWPATITRVDVTEGRARIGLSGPMEVRADVTVQSVDQLELRPGSRIWASVKATELTVVA